MTGSAMSKRAFAAFVMMSAFVAAAATGKSFDIQSRIDEMSKKGGGTVEIPAGIHESGAIVLKSGVTLRLVEGAVLRARPEAEAYAPTEGNDNTTSAIV